MRVTQTTAHRAKQNPPGMWLAWNFREVKVMHIQKFDRVNGYYDKGLWTADMVRNSVGEWITAEEAEEILSEE